MEPETLYALSVVGVLLSASGVLLNICIIVTIARHAVLQVLENSFLIGLVVTDVLTSVCNLLYPFAWTSTNDGVCLPSIIATSYTACASLLSLAAMSLNKYMQICHPFHHVHLCNKRNICFIVVFIHVCSIALGFVTFGTYNRTESEMCIGYLVFPDIFILILQIVIFLFVLAIALLNIRVLYVSCKTKKQIHNTANNNARTGGSQGVKILAVIVMFNFVLYIPVCLIMTIHVAWDLPRETLEVVEVWSIASWMILPVVDGISLLFCRKDIRQCAWKMCRCSRA